MKAIAAMSGNRVIGNNGTVPWKNRMDMRFFQCMTWGQKVVVGSATYEKMGPLESRFHYVLSNTKSYTVGTDKNNPITEFLSLKQFFAKKVDDVWIIGGAKVYNQFIPLCTDLYLSVIPEDYEGDTYMPEFESHFTDCRIIKEFKDLYVVHYWKPTTLTKEIYREGFDAGLMGMDVVTDNPHQFEYYAEGISTPLSGKTEACKLWERGCFEAPWIRGFNYDKLY